MSVKPAVDSKVPSYALLLLDGALAARLLPGVALALLLLAVRQVFLLCLLLPLAPRLLPQPGGVLRCLERQPGGLLGAGGGGSLRLASLLHVAGCCGRGQAERGRVYVIRVCMCVVCRMCVCVCVCIAKRGAQAGSILPLAVAGRISCGVHRPSLPFLSPAAVTWCHLSPQHSPRGLLCFSAPCHQTWQGGCVCVWGGDGRRSKRE